MLLYYPDTIKEGNWNRCSINLVWKIGIVNMGKWHYLKWYHLKVKQKTNKQKPQEHPHKISKHWLPITLYQRSWIFLSAFSKFLRIFPTALQNTNTLVFQLAKGSPKCYQEFKRITSNHGINMTGSIKITVKRAGSWETWVLWITSALWINGNRKDFR